jgi:hypothetical protein
MHRPLYRQQQQRRVPTARRFTALCCVALVALGVLLLLNSSVACEAPVQLLATSVATEVTDVLEHYRQHGPSRVVGRKVSASGKRVQLWLAPSATDNWCYGDVPQPTAYDYPPLDVHLAAWAGTTLHALEAPLPETDRIPKRVFVTWKSKTLVPRAQYLYDHWAAMEPTYERVVVDDGECRQLAAKFPGLLPRYDHVPLNVMRADICRQLAVYYLGGIYKDLDVAWVRPLSTWLDRRKPVAYGDEDDEHLCQWFFAARPGNRCIGQVIQHITNIITNVTHIDFDANSEAVIDITGPGAFTDGMRGCPTPPQFTQQDMQTQVIIHEYAAQQWKASINYSSWLVDRQEQAGWKDQFWKGGALAYLRPDSDVTLGVARQTDANGFIMIGRVAVSGSRHAMFAADWAIDGNVDTSVRTESADWVLTSSWWEATFADPMVIGTTPTEMPRHLTCARVYSERNLSGPKALIGLALELYDERGKMIHRTAPKTEAHGYQHFYFGGVDIVSVHALRVVVPWRSLAFAEIQLFSDFACEHAVPLRLPSRPPSEWRLPRRPPSAAGCQGTQYSQFEGFSVRKLVAPDNTWAIVMDGEVPVQVESRDVFEHRGAIIAVGSGLPFLRGAMPTHNVSVVHARIPMTPATVARALHSVLADSATTQVWLRATRDVLLDVASTVKPAHVVVSLAGHTTATDVEQSIDALAGVGYQLCSADGAGHDARVLSFQRR